MKIVLLTILNSLLMATGQLLWKSGMMGKTIENLSDIIRALFSPLILLGLFVYACTTMLWLYILNQADISYVYPIQSLAFVIVPIAAALIFREQIPINRWIGIATICLGVYLVSIK
ncbi:EamA family transporter [Clostridiaceae bacterium 35-E11]